MPNAIGSHGISRPAAVSKISQRWTFSCALENVRAGVDGQGIARGRAPPIARALSCALPPRAIAPTRTQPGQHYPTAGWIPLVAVNGT